MPAWSSTFSVGPQVSSSFQSIQTFTYSGLSSYSGQGLPAVQPFGFVMKTSTSTVSVALGFCWKLTSWMYSYCTEPPELGQ